MATYEWACHDCKLIWDREYKMGKAPERTKCPQCRKISERVFYATPTHFKGSGFYETDYKEKMSHQDAKEFYKNAMSGSKNRMAEGWKQYGRYTLTEKAFEDGIKDGSITKDSAEVSKAKKGVEDQVLKEAYGKSGLNREEYKKTKPQ